MDKLFDISGKVAVITGGTRGLGEMIAKGFVQSGVTTYVTSRKAEACQRVQEKLSEYGTCIAHPSDLSSLDGIRQFSDWFQKREPCLDILINNAGATWGETLDDFPESGWDRVMDINVKGLFFLTQSMLPALRAAAKKSNRAKVINVGSVEGSTLPIHRKSFAYPASKAAVHHLTRILAGTLSTENITVNAIAPGPFVSKMTEFLFSDSEENQRITSEIPLGRPGNDDDIFGLAAFLSSAASDFITGETIHLDGGYVKAR